MRSGHTPARRSNVQQLQKNHHKVYLTQRRVTKSIWGLSVGGDNVIELRPLRVVIVLESGMAVMGWR
jgi:hypothetical protein